MYKLPLEGNKVKALLIVYLGVRRVAELELREKGEGEGDYPKETKGGIKKRKERRERERRERGINEDKRKWR